MPFHRFKDPAYFGSGAFPGAIFGETYDRINVVSEGVGSGDGSAVVEVAKPAPHPNEGTYFVAFGEDGLSSHVNRGLRALSDNTDYIDDIIHRDLAVPSILTPPVPGGPLDTMVLTGDVFVGPVGTPNNTASLSSLIVLLDANNNPLHFLDAGEWKSPKVTQIHDGSNNNVIGQDFYTDPTIDIDPPIPAGTAFRVGHAVRGRIVDQPAGLISRLDSGWSGTEDLWALARNITQIDQTFLGDNTHSGDNVYSGTNSFTVAGATSIAEAAAAGAPISLGVGTVTSHIQDLLDELNLHVNGTYQHPDDEVTSAAIAGAPNSLSGGSVRTHLTELLGFINPLTDAVGIAYAGGGAWHDGDPNPATTVEGQLDKIISDLAAVDGADKLGGSAVYNSTGTSGTGLAAGSVWDQLRQLADQAEGRVTLSSNQTISGQKTFSNSVGPFFEGAMESSKAEGLAFTVAGGATAAAVDGVICRDNTVKAWVTFSAQGTILQEWNVLSVVRDPGGGGPSDRYVITFRNALLSNSIVVSGSGFKDALGNNYYVAPALVSASTVELHIFETGAINPVANIEGIIGYPGQPIITVVINGNM